MKLFFFISLSWLVSMQFAEAQELNSHKKIRQVYPKAKIPVLDTVKYHSSIIDSSIMNSSESVEMPNALDLGAMYYYDMPLKKLSGKESVRMPGTEPLDKMEKLKPSTQSHIIRPDRLMRISKK